MALAGEFTITTRIDPDTDQPFNLVGAGRGAFNGATPVEGGTIFSLDGAATALFRARTNNTVVHRFDHFMCLNKTGEADCKAFETDTSIGFASFGDLSVGNFQFAFDLQKCLYLTFDRILMRGCDYGISCWNVNETPPLTLNSNFFNNVISIRDAQCVDALVGYRLAGACINLQTIDATDCSTAGLQIGGADFSKTSFSADGLYFEGASGVPLQVVNGVGRIGTIFFSSARPIGIEATNSRFSVDFADAYGAITTLVDNDNSRVFVNDTAGTITSAYTNSNGGLSVVNRFQVPVQATSLATLAQGETSTVTSAVRGSVLTELTVWISDNGTQKLQKYVIRGTGVKRVTTEDTPSTYLTVTSALNGSTGHYDVTFTNSAGFAYSIQILHYSFVPLNLATL